MNAFFRIWKKALAGLNDFIPFKIDWMKVPRAGKGGDTLEETNKKFKQNQINTIGQISWEQEYECVEGDTVISLKDKETGKLVSMTISEVNNILKKIKD